jgi:hypothetical protein
MTTFFRVLLAAATFALCNTAGAAVINGTISTIDGNADGKAQELKIARVAFTVNAGTNLFFDSLVLEALSDINGDGHITGFDNEMMLFSGTELLTSNDDSANTYADGSQHLFDSAFRWNFDQAGTYMVTLGIRDYTKADALRGYEAGKVYRPYVGIEDFGAWRLTLTALSGVVSNVHEIGAEVPEPGTLALFGTGLLGAGWLRRRRR